MDNAQIADRLESLAALLELAEANPYTVRAYRRAAETIRSMAVAAGEIAELAALQRELAPDLVGLGRFLGLSAKRSIELARSLGVRTAEELREAAAAGRLRTVPGIGPKTEARLLEALVSEAEPRPRQGLLLDRARDLLGAVAAALDGEAAGDVRRWRDSCERLVVVCAARDPRPALARFAALPQIVAVIEQRDRWAVGVTVEGVPVEVTVAEPERLGTAFVRATGSSAYVEALEPLPDAPEEVAVYRALGLPWCPPELREAPFRGEPPDLVEPEQIRCDLHCHTTWSDSRCRRRSRSR